MFSEGLYFAAKDHCIDIGENNLASHEGSDGSRMVDRIERYGEWKTSIAENICFDDYDPQEILFNMLIGKFYFKFNFKDDGNPTRGHRNNMFSNDFRYAGLSVYHHKQYKFCCVMKFAVHFISSTEKRHSALDSLPNPEQIQSLNKKVNN